VAWACAAVAAIWLGPSVALLLRAHVSTPFLAPVLAYVGIFLLVLVPLAVLSARIAHSVHQSTVGTVDRCLGVPFGVARGLIIVGLAYLAITLVIPFSAQPAWLTGARLMPVVKGSSDLISSLLPHFGRAFIDRDGPPAVRADNGTRVLYQTSDRHALDRLVAKTNAARGSRP
jgi:membrane protein required for colicin V production